MKILVTGGAGFIGSHLVDKLIKEGHKVVVIDNLSTGKKENINPKAKFYKIDIQDPGVSQVFKKEKPEIVFHYAAQIDVIKSVKNPIEDAKINILGTLNPLENCRKFKVKKFIFPSSVGVYGEAQYVPITENHPLNPLSPYPITKLAIEKYLNFYQTLGLDFVSLRYSNIYGPRQLSKGEGGVVAIFIDRLLRGERPVIYGTGEQTRDFLYIDDAVDAAIKALKAPSGAIYNTGTNQEITINNLLKKLSLELKTNPEPIFSSSRPGEITISRIDFQKIKKELNWQPQFDLDKGLKKTVEWFKNR